MGNIKKWPLIIIYGKMDGFIRGYWSTYPIYVWLNPGENWNFDGTLMWVIRMGWVMMHGRGFNDHNLPNLGLMNTLDMISGAMSGLMIGWG